MLRRALLPLRWRPVTCTRVHQLMPRVASLVARRQLATGLCSLLRRPFGSNRN
jgi:hypothetical protein